MLVCSTPSLTPQRSCQLSSPSKTEESWISRMAEASTMFLTMKRLMALSLGTITPEASQRTRRTCSSSPPHRQLLLLLSPAAKPPAALIADSPGPCHACCVLLQEQTMGSAEQREKRPGRHHQGWSSVCDRCAARQAVWTPETPALTVPATQQEQREGQHRVCCGTAKMGRKNCAHLRFFVIFAFYGAGQVLPSTKRPSQSAAGPKIPLGCKNLARVRGVGSFFGGYSET